MFSYAGSFYKNNVTIQDQCMEINKSSCLHVKDIAFHAKNPNRAPPPHISIFSLVKGEKEHEVFEMRI